ncbi:MAG: ABC transporter ATP-binding protein, partial [Chloroflexi bacterium]|nr:ABC transporter ATP-binding protein [Chloroflexota bacterium]
ILLKVRNLKKHFPIRSGLLRRQSGAVQAVDGINFDIYQGETLGLVGGVGAGKSTAVRAILHLMKPTSGSVSFAGQELTKLGKSELRKMRSRMQLIFEDPYLAMNPRMRLKDIIGEPLQIHNMGNSQNRKQRIEALLAQVELNAYFVERFPYEFSGAQRQRISLARALATEPELVVADDILSMLDPVVQEQLVALLHALKQQLGLTYLYVAQDLTMVNRICDRIAIMYAGRIVELARTDGVYERPLHPYTQFLRSSLPLDDPDMDARRQKISLLGDPPDMAKPPTGCRFHPRCAYATDL